MANTVLYQVLFISAGNYKLVVVHSVSLFLYALVLWFNLKKYYSRAKHFLLYTVGVEIFVITLLLGTDTGMHIYFFPLICAVLILFEYNQLKKACLIVITYLLLVMALYIPLDLHALRIDVSDTFKQLFFLSNLIISLLLTILCIYHLLSANTHIENGLRMAVSIEENLNKELLIREEELKAHVDHLSVLSREVLHEKAKLTAIVENFDYYICCIDKEYRLIYCNSNYLILFINRFGRQLQIGDRLLDYFPGDVTERWKGLYDRALAGEKFMQEVQGQSWIHEAHFCPIIEKDNVIAGITVFMQNISERKAAEREIIAAKELAEQATHAKSDFLSNMSHEIRTPMNAVIGLTRLLIDQNPRPDQLELLQVLRFSSENLLSIINDILDLQKIEAGKMVLEKADFNIQELLHNLIHSMQLKAQEKNIELLCETDPQLPPLLNGDSVRLTQVLSNILSNAVKFTESGFVKLSVKLIKQKGDEYILQFSVQDTGIGIAKEKLAVIFNAFEQAEADTTRKYGGTGLGLAITKRLIELQAGKLEVESEAGTGTTFYCTLAFTRGVSAHTSVYLPDTYRPNLSHVQLLLVEDNMVNMMVASKYLQKWNIQPAYASDGKEALEKVQQTTYDIVLMDLQMPVMNGFEACKQIRKLAGPFTHLPIVALTADVSGDVQQRVAEAGMNAYLSKPFIEEELYTVIATLTKKAILQTPASGKSKYTSLTGIRKKRSFNLEQVLSVADGDEEFVHKIIMACQENLLEVHTSFATYMQVKNAEALQALKHKLKTSISMFELHLLQSLLQQGVQLLQVQNTNETEVHRLIYEVEQECILVKTELDKYITQS